MDYRPIAEEFSWLPGVSGFLLQSLATLTAPTSPAQTLPETSPQARPQRAGEEEYDVVVIGGGPGGYVSAIRASQLGGKVALIEKKHLGGTCLNIGCIPSKALLHVASLYEKITQAKSLGVLVDHPRVDLEALGKHRDQTVLQLRKGVEFLLKKNRVEVITGEGRLLKNRVVRVGNREIHARKVILAYGSVVKRIPIPGLDSYVTSDEALFNNELPESILIIGAGAIGMEFAYFYHALGVRTIVVEMMPQVLPGIDEEIAGELYAAFRRKGVQIYTNSQVKSAERKGQRWVLTVTSPKGEEQVEVAQVMMAVGRAPATFDQGLEELNIKMDRGFILVDQQMQTSLPGVYAIGDIVPGPQLAHKASAEGKVAAENCMGISSKMDYRAIPACIYTKPEVASVGLREQEAREKGYDVRVGRFPYSALGKGLAMGERHGLFKIVSEAKYGEILGVHIVGPQATDLIAEAVTAIVSEATVEELAHSIHPHPTLSEGLHEAALDALGRPIHKA